MTGDQPIGVLKKGQALDWAGRAQARMDAKKCGWVTQRGPRTRAPLLNADGEPRVDEDGNEIYPPLPDDVSNYAFQHPGFNSNDIDL